LPLAASILACFATWPGLASAQPDSREALEPVRLSWVRSAGAESCPGPHAIEDRVRASLGRDPFASDAPVVIEAMVDRTEQGWHALLRLRGRDGHIIGSRELSTEDPTCHGMARAMVLAVALTIDPTAPIRTEALGPTPSSAPESPAGAAESPSVEATEPPAVEATAPPPVEATAPPAPAPPIGLAPPVPPRARVAPVLVSALGVVPSPGWGAGVLTRVPVSPRWSAELQMLWLGERSVQDDRFSFGWTAGAAGPCLTLARSPHTELASCALLQVGAMHATVRGAEAVEPGQSLWLAVTGSPRLTTTLASPVDLVLGVDVVVPVLRREYLVVGDDTTRAFLPSTVAGIGHVGVAVTFP
jgi:hypothetical protein